MSYQKLRVIDDKCLDKFKKESKCCIIIKDLVYDVTSFFDHPGGYDIFKDYAGNINIQNIRRIFLCIPF